MQFQDLTIKKGYKSVKYLYGKNTNIPVDWSIVSIKDVTKSHKQGFYTNEPYSKDGIRLVRITDLKNPYVSYETMPLLKLDDKTISDFKVSKDDVFIARSGAIGRFGVVKENIPCVFGSYIIRFKFNPKLDNGFFGYIYQTKSIIKQLLMIQQGSSNININAENIKSIKILFPPLKEQQKIASILSKVDELIQKTEQIIEENRRLKKGFMQRLLTKGIGHTNFKKTKLGEIPEEWEVFKIQDICKTSSGGTPSRANPEYYKGNIPWIKTGELKDGYIFKTEESISENALRSSSAKLFPTETVLFAMYGATIGKTAITKISATTNQACCAFIPLKKESIHPYFLQQYFILVRPKIISKGEGAVQPNTSQDFLKTFPIIYPPFKEQQKIASILSNLDELIQKRQNNKLKVENLKKDLMQQLLTGKIRVKV